MLRVGELGLEPHVGTGVADAHDVPLLLRNRDFAVRNDGIPATEVRTIDIIHRNQHLCCLDNPIEPGGNKAPPEWIFFFIRRP